MPNFINYAHRGAPAYCPENTFMSFYTGLYMGANGIETDVQKTKDGVLVLFHDDTVTRVTGAEGKIGDYTYEELLKLDVKNGDLKDKIPTLEDFLAHFSHFDITFAIELKGADVEKGTADLIHKYGVQDKCIATSFAFEYIENIKKYAPDLRVGLLTGDPDEKLIAELKRIDAYEVCPIGSEVTAEKVEKWHSLGFNVRAWGIFDLDIMKNVYDAGADGMTVNFPDKLTEYIKEKAEQ